MGIPRLTSCCCGCSLRTGTLILLYLALVGGIMAPFSNPPPMKNAEGKEVHQDVPMSAKLPGAIIVIAISCCGLYGVYTERQGFLIPYLIVTTLGVIVLFIGFILTLFINIIAALIYLVFAFLPVYFWLVVFNHYRELEEGKRSSSAA